MEMSLFKISGAAFALALSASLSYAEQTDPSVNKELAKIEEKSRVESEQKYEQLKNDAKDKLDPDALIITKEVEKAIDALTHKKDKESLAALERATEKLNILLARRPFEALLPVFSKIEMIDVAPRDINIIKDISKAAEKAVEAKDYSEGRGLLDMLQSEITSCTTYLPLEIYPTALKEAARLLNEKKYEESILVLRTALSSLVITHQTTSIPSLKAISLLTAAEVSQEKDKDLSLKFITQAQDELERVKALGYLGEDHDEYDLLKKSMEDLKKHIKNNRNSSSLFDKLCYFLKRLNNREKEVLPKSNSKSTKSLV